MFNTPNLYGIAQGIVKVAAPGRAATAAARVAEKSHETPRSWLDYLSYPIGAGVAALKSGAGAASNAAKGIADAGAANLAVGANEAANRARKLVESKQQDVYARLNRAGSNAMQAARNTARSVAPVAPLIAEARNAVK